MMEVKNFVNLTTNKQWRIEIDGYTIRTCPLAAALTWDDFFLTRVVGDFEDETLYHFDGSGEILETVSLGAKRMTYEQVLCPNDTLLLNNSYLLEQFSLRAHEITPFANKKNSMKTMSAATWPCGTRARRLLSLTLAATQRCGGKR